MLKKKVNLLISFVIGIFATFLAKAQIYGSRSSAWDNINFFGNYIDTSLIGWGLMFLVFLGILSVALARTPFFKNHKGPRIIISLCLSLGATYGVMKSNFSLSSFLWSLGLDPENFLPIILAGLAILGLGIMIYKYNLLRGILHTMWITGFALMMASLTDLVYEQLIVFVAGAILFLLGVWVLKKKSKSGGSSGGGEGEPEPQVNYGKGKHVLNIKVNGNGTTKPRPGSHNMKEGKKVKITARPSKGSKFKYFMINGKKEKRRKAKFRMKGDYNVTAYFGGQGGSGPNPDQGGQNQGYGIRKLIQEAKNFRKWADKKKNPKMYRSWARFVKWLKNRKYGRNEKEILKAFGVTNKDMTNVVKKYVK